MHEGPEYGLPPRSAPCLGEDGGEDIDELGEAGDFHAIGVAKQGYQQAADHEGVLEMVLLLKKGGTDLPRLAIPVLGPLIYITRNDQNTISQALPMFRAGYGTDYRAIMAACCMAVGPVIGLYIVGQRSFIEGIVLSGLKS